jgi:O-antigen ligase/predicted negative regulator of RcsB-dependent stress response
MRLHLLSNKVIQFGLPAIVLLVPPLINPFGYTVYPYPKIALFRFATLLLLTAWLVDLVNRRESTGSLGDLLARPLALPVFLFAFTHILSTITSVAPRMSFWGSFFRAFGIYTVLCYVIFFFLIILRLNTARQIEQLITIALLASLPVALYGVLQHSGIDPLFPGSDYSRVISTIGNPIFLGAYLIMVIPLALGRLSVSLRTLLGGSPSSPSCRSTLLEVIGYASLLILQAACLLYTKSRGPWFGLLGGVLLFAILAGLRYRLRKLLLITLAVSVAFVALLLALNLPHTPLEPFSESPYLSRLVLSENLTRGTGTEWVRLLIWQGTFELIKSRPNVGFTPDPLRPLRLFIGYGPETMEIVFHQVYPPSLAHIEAREAVVDRAHNELLDLVVTTGVLGLLAFLFLMGSFFYYGLSLLRWTGDFKVQITVIALLSAMFAHLIEAQFGLLIPSVSLLFWLYLAAVSVMHDSEGLTVQRGHMDTVSLTGVETGTQNVRWLQTVVSLLVVCVIPFFASFSNINFVLANVYLRQGERFKSARQYTDSIAAYNKAIQVFPVEPRFYEYKAAAYYELAQSISDDEREARSQLLQAGVDALAKAIELQPLDPEYYACTGTLYGYWARTVDPSKLEQAVEFYERAFQLSPNRALYRNELARFYFDAGRYEDAVQQLQVSLEIDPKFHATHYNLGLVYLELGEKEKAKEQFETALRLDPECEECAQRLEALKGD